MISGIQEIIDRWYISEPALLKVFFSHILEKNTSISCPFRCGRGMIEYNPNIVETLNAEQLELYLKAEAIRIILKHPYERQPDGCGKLAKSIGSNLVLADNYDFDGIVYAKPSKYSLLGNESFEWYSMRIESMLSDGRIFISDEPNEVSNNSTNENEHDNNPSNTSNVNDKSPAVNNNDDNNASENDDYVLKLANGSEMRIPKRSRPVQNASQTSNALETNQGHAVKLKSIRMFNTRQAGFDLAEMWEEDSLMNSTIDYMINEIQNSGKGWGSIAGNIVEYITAGTKAKIDYRKTLSGFRASVLSSKRQLTRMRPNRRSGFDNMGCIRQFSTNLLVAVDVSASVTDNMLAHFFSVIGRIFKYGIERIDVIQFDCSVSEVISLAEAPKRIRILGRGGTNFQPVFDFTAKHHEYDGLIIFTDGDAPKPKKPKGMKARVVWVCEDKRAYEAHKKWMKLTGRCCMMQL